jgi:hypothetical protein
MAHEMAQILRFSRVPARQAGGGRLPSRAIIRCAATAAGGYRETTLSQAFVRFG